MSFTTILKNSATAHFLKKVSYGSRFLALADSLVETVPKIIAGSRVVSFFKVRDYLEVDSKPLASLLKNAKIYRRTHNLVLPCIHRVRSWIKALHLDQSELVSWTAGRKRQREEILTRRNILVFGLVFLGVFYILRFLLLTFIPQGDFRISWSAGLLLTLVLIVILLQLAPKNNSPSRTGSGPGLIQNTGSLFIRLAVNSKRWLRFTASDDDNQ